MTKEHKNHADKQEKLSNDDMLIATDTEYAPWHIVPADDKKRARLNCN
jgi:polyphosphate kinase 2 (PPK2 family)